MKKLPVLLITVTDMVNCDEFRFQLHKCMRLRERALPNSC